MELLADRDPEEARKLLDPVLELMMEAVHRYEGTVNQVMGDGIMALFGAPLAHEDHAVRACYAALRMQESLKRRADGRAPRARGGGTDPGRPQLRGGRRPLGRQRSAHGLHRRRPNHPPRGPYGAVGATGNVRLTAETVRLAEGWSRCDRSGPIPVKGLSTPIEIFELTGVGTARTRLQAAALQGLTRFVGRDAEIEHLRRMLGQAGDGQGQVVAIVGEAGMGKSRLLYEFTHSHQVQDWLILEASSVSYGKATSYLPVIDLLKGYFKIDDRDDHAEMRAKVLGRVLGLDRALEPLLSPLLALLDVPVEDPRLAEPGPAAAPAANAGRGQAPAASGEPGPTASGSVRGPTLDRRRDPGPAGQPGGEPGSARLLLLVTYRPEYASPLGEQDDLLPAPARRLPAESAAELLAALLGPDPGLGSLKQLLVKRGNPFFLEETVRTLVETGALAGERGAYRLTRPVEALQMPATVQAILAARIDRLPPEDKQLLQAASVIGKDVPVRAPGGDRGAAGRGSPAGARASAGRRSSSTRRSSSLTWSTPSSTRSPTTWPTAGLLGERRRDLARRRWSAPSRRLHAIASSSSGAAGPSRAAGRGVGQGSALPAPGRSKASLRSANQEAVTLLRAGARSAPAPTEAS